MCVVASRQTLAAFLLPVGPQTPETLAEGLLWEREMCTDLRAALFLFRDGRERKFFVFGGNCAILYNPGQVVRSVSLAGPHLQNARGQQCEEVKRNPTRTLSQTFKVNAISLDQLWVCLGALSGLHRYEQQTCLL